MKSFNKQILAVIFSFSLAICLSACFSSKTPQPNLITRSADEPNSPVRSPIPKPQERPAQFAFSMDNNGQLDIYIGNTDGVIVKQLTDDPANDKYPLFSPDGMRIVFCSNRSGTDELYIMNADGSQQTLLTDQLPGCISNPDRPMTWSPDGKWISLAGFTEQNYQVADLYIVRSDGSRVVKLTDAPDFIGGFSWDPDSKSIILLIARDTPDIYRIDINNKKITRLMEEPVWGIPAGFSPDGSQFLLRVGQKGTIQVITISSKKAEIKALTSSEGSDSYPLWSQDGQQILFMRTEGQDADIYRMNADGSGQTNLTSGSGVANYWPSLSPDGQKIIYLTNSENQWETMIMNADGSGKSRVTDVFGVIGSLSWQP